MVHWSVALFTFLGGCFFGALIVCCVLAGTHNDQDDWSDE